MRKIASPKELESSLQALIRYSESAAPSRSVIAQKLDELSSRLKTARSEGPFAEITDSYVAIWFSGTSYGRTHHVTNDITSAEKVLEKMRSSLLDNLYAAGLNQIDPGEISVDGRAGGENLIISFFIGKRGGGWDEGTVADAVDQIKGYGIRDWRKFPR